MEKKPNICVVKERIEKTYRYYYDNMDDGHKVYYKKSLMPCSLLK